MPSHHLVVAALSSVAVVAASTSHHALTRPHAPKPPEAIAINDNRVPAGTLRGGVLSVRLDAREGEWHPDADAGPGVIVRAFAAGDGPLQAPGPLLRVPEGTEIRVVVHNALKNEIVIHGMNTRGRRPAPGNTPEPQSIAAGATREIRFDASSVGTFYYWATTTGATHVADLDGIDSQLSGAFVVDPAGAPPPADRIFLISLWSANVRVDTGTVPTGRFVMNGKSWPYTERLAYAVGDSVRVRLINAGVAVHPMHLHGSYYNVDTRGNEQTDSVLSVASPHLVNTERLASGRTFSMTWVPARSGNWLFHCHDPVHISAPTGFDGSPPMNDADLDADHMLDMMSGPVIGIVVRDTAGAAPVAEPRSSRHLRLVARVDSGGTAAEPAFRYTIDGGAPMLVVQRGAPVSITVVNRLPEPTSVHWHGIELDSYYDGVAGFSGHPGHLAPRIAPNDSFIARFTPPRSGTFMYHPHVGEVRQQQAGLDGALIVVDSLRRYDPKTNIVLLVTTPRLNRDSDVVFVNGTATPPARELRAGTTYRIRLLNLHNNRPSMIMKILRDSTPLTWRATAKDGMDLPADQATVRASMQQMGNGETYDFTFTPTEPGDLRFEVTTAVGQVLAAMPLHVTRRDAQRSEPPDLILVRGKVFTATAERPWAEAVAIRAAHIAAVGTTAEIRALAGPRTRTIDLAGRVVIPGFNDAHDHLGSDAPIGVSFETDSSPMPNPSFAQVTDSIRALVGRTHRGTWIVGHVRDRVLDDTAARRTALDAIAPDHPVMLLAGTGHGIIMNTVALRRAGIPEDAVDLVGGWYERSPDGRLTGLLQEYAGWSASRRLSSTISDRAIVASLREYGDFAVRHGITSVQDMANSLDPARTLRVFRAAALPLRVRIIRMPMPTSSSRALAEWNVANDRSSPLITISGRKWILEGTPIERLALQRSAYDGRPTWHGRLNYPSDTVKAILAEALASHEQIMLHVGGDSSLALVLSMMQHMAPGDVWRPLRVRIEHGDGMEPDLARVAAQLGVVVVQNPAHFAGADGELHLDATRRATNQPFASLLHAGIPIAIGSDNARNPFVNLMFATERPRHPAESLTRDEAVTAYTRGSAFAEFREKEKGTLAPGMLADLAVLSQDIFAVPSAALPRTTSVLTIIGGTVVYDAHVLESPRH